MGEENVLVTGPARSTRRRSAARAAVVLLLALVLPRIGPASVGPTEPAGAADCDPATGVVAGCSASDVLRAVRDEGERRSVGATSGSPDSVAAEVDHCAVDSDADGLWDCEEDADADGDGDPSTAPGPDTDGDTTPDHLDDDDDGDGIPTDAEGADPNGDGDPRDALDTDRDGQPDHLDVPTTRTEGRVRTEQKISSTAGGLVGPLGSYDQFGESLAPLGDLDGDGVVDLAVGAYQADGGGTSRGAVHVLFLDADGSVRAEQEISDVSGELASTLDDFDQFGRDIASLGDVDGDGVVDLAVGTYRDDDGGSNRGAVYVLFLAADGTVRAEQKISDTAGGLSTPLADGDEFGRDVAGVGDIDGDGVNDLAAGAGPDDGDGTTRGAVHVLLLNEDGTVKAEQRIATASGGLTAALDDDDQFGTGLSGIGDLDGDGVVDLVVGAAGDDDGASDAGAVHVLFLAPDGTVRAEQKISAVRGGLTATLQAGDGFGSSVEAIGDLDRDGVVDLAVGADGTADGANGAGAVHLLLLDTDGTVAETARISATSGGIAGPLDGLDAFGSDISALGDLDGDGAVDLAVGARGDDDGAVSAGAVHVLHLTPGLTVNSTGDAVDADAGDGVCATGASNSRGAPACTLRAALEEVAALGGGRDVHVAIPTSDEGHADGVWTIEVTGDALPALGVADVAIDGSSQPGWVASPVVVVDGSAVTSGRGLQLSGDRTSVRSLAVVGFPGAGVRVTGDGSSVVASHLGALADGVAVAGNGGAGVVVADGATDVTIGGRTAGAGNLVVDNGGDGVVVTGAATDGVAVVGNRVHGNGGLGVDLVAPGDPASGVTPADTGDGDAGPNGLLNPPVLAATATGGTTTVTARLDVPAGAYLVEVFTNPAGADRSGHGEAQLPVASQVVTHPGGDASYRVDVPVGGTAPLTAAVTTCVDGAGCADLGSTSELSRAVVPATSGLGSPRPLRDSSGNRQDARTAGEMAAPDVVAGAVGRGLDLDGDDDQLLLDNLDVDGGAFTITAWVRPDGAAEDARVVTKETSDAAADRWWTLGFDDSTTLRLDAVRRSGAATAPAAPASDAWTQLTGTWDGETLRLFQDGVLLDGRTRTGTPVADPSVVTRIGGAPQTGPGGQSRQLDGRVDEVRVLGTARSAAWIAAEHANQSSPATFAVVGARQSRILGSWSVADGAGRAGSRAAAAPDDGAGSWLLARGLDEPGLLVDAWWRFSDPSGAQLGQGVRAGTPPVGPVQQETALRGTAGWDLGNAVGSSRTPFVLPTGSSTPGSWHRVVVRVDQRGELVARVDGERVGATDVTGGPTRGTAGFRVGRLPAGERWWVDDVRVRRFVTPEPTTRLGVVEER